MRRSIVSLGCTAHQADASPLQSFIGFLKISASHTVATVEVTVAMCWALALVTCYVVRDALRMALEGRRRRNSCVSAVAVLYLLQRVRHSSSYGSSMVRASNL